MRTELEYLPEHLQKIIDGLDDKQMARLRRAVAVKLRTEQRKRITRQENTDGSSYAPRRIRKPLRKMQAKGLAQKKHRIKKMFHKIKQAQHMRIEYRDNSINIGYVGLLGYIANIHQYGLIHNVGKEKTPVRYPIRELLGLTDENIEMVDEEIMNYIEKLLGK